MAPKFGLVIPIELSNRLSTNEMLMIVHVDNVQNMQNPADLGA